MAARSGGSKRSASDAAADNRRFRRACELWDGGELRRAFGMFLVGARGGDVSSQVNLGYFYEQGLGVRQNRDRAVYWYRRAYRKGSAIAASNIGVILQEQGRLRDAVERMCRSVRRGNKNIALQLGEIYLAAGKMRLAQRYLKTARDSARTSEDTQQRARRLLKRIEQRRERS